MKQGIIFTSSKSTGYLVTEMVKDIFSIKLIPTLAELICEMRENEYDFLIIDHVIVKELPAINLISSLANENVKKIPPSLFLTFRKYNPLTDGEGYSFILRKPFVKSEIIEAINFILDEKSEKKLNNILIVDDSKTSRRIIIKSLLKHGFNCFEAENGEEGLKKAVELLPDLIIVDYVMPDMNGIELARKISKNEKLRKVPIILISGSKNFNAIIEEGFNSGISAYFKKPFDENEVFQFFRKYFYTTIPSKILILDDSPTRRKVIYSNLVVNNNQVFTTDTINKTIHLLEDNEFDLVLIDLVLHNETGFDAVNAIRKLNKDIPIIVYSSIADRRNVYKVLELGASDFLWAPIEMRELILKVKIWLGYSKFLNFNKILHEKIEKLEIQKEFMELVDAYFNNDKLNSVTSTLICIKNQDISESLIKENIRKNDKVGKHNDMLFIYAHEANLLEAFKICKRIQQSIKNKLIAGISTTDKVNTIEELFSLAEKNIINV